MQPKKTSKTRKNFKDNIKKFNAPYVAASLAHTQTAGILLNIRDVIISFAVYFEVEFVT